MKRRYEDIFISLVLLFLASLASCQDDRTSPEATATDIGGNAAPTAIVANTNSTAFQDLRYIWTIAGIENYPVTMALDQDGHDLFGQAKYEPDSGEPWNGNVAGFVSGEEVHLFIAALKGDKQISMALDGVFDNDAISGKFFKTSEGMISDRGVFNAEWINPDLASYTPAKIKETKSNSQGQEANATMAADTNQLTVQLPQQKTIYHDVHQDADRILTGVGDISQIPIGMGGSGLP